MPFRRTDKAKLYWPKGISSEDRRFCREIFGAMKSFYERPELNVSGFVIACSAGLDSTVLSHIHKQTRTLMGMSVRDDVLVYIDHKLRSPEEIANDIFHVEGTALRLGYQWNAVGVLIEPGNIQAQASAARYKALAEEAGKKTVLLAQHANDVAETKLWQFLTGREPNGINEFMVKHGVVFARPLLSFTREELERYCRIWDLSWQEDSSNGTKKYARNRIRQELIPWIEKELNPGIVKMLAK